MKLSSIMKIFVSLLIALTIQISAFADQNNNFPRGSIDNPILLKDGIPTQVDAKPNSTLYAKIHIVGQNKVTLIFYSQTDDADIFGRFNAYPTTNEQGYDCFGVKGKKHDQTGYKLCYMPQTSTGDYWMKITTKKGFTHALIAASVLPLNKINPFNLEKRHF